MLSGIKVDNRAAASIVINANPVGELYAIDVTIYRFVTFEANGKTYKIEAAVWNTGGSVGKSNLKSAINSQMDKFLLAYLKANPKKKEK